MNFTRLKLYHYPATRSARVKWLLHELLDDDFDVEVVPLDDAVAQTVANILAGAPLAARYNKRAIRGIAAPPASDDAILAAAAAYGDTEDYHNAYKAFLAKTKAAFKGR